MKFAEGAQRLARSYGVRLGVPYAQAKRALVRQGWQVDTLWTEAQDSPGRDGELVCGAGLDALCSTAFVPLYASVCAVSACWALPPATS